MHTNPHLHDGAPGLAQPDNAQHAGRRTAGAFPFLLGSTLLGTIGGSLIQAVHQASERDAAVLTFLITASGVTLAGIGSAFWGVVLGGVSYGVLSALRRP